VRSIVCRYETARALVDALASQDRELTVQRGRVGDAPPSSRGIVDGEWVLAIVELTSGGLATSAAARVRRHGGELTLSFETRDWSRVRSLLDRQPPTAPSPVRPARTQSAPPSTTAFRKLGDGGGARILLVDDDHDVGSVVSAMLEAVGFTVVVSPTGEDGLHELEEGAFDLVVLDWTLPGMSGLDLCRAVRTRWARLPVLFLTANATSRDVVEAFAGGADDYVVKPFRAPELGARIFGLLRRVGERE
jgi:two-component system phosphate regulon response regulator PhoB